MKSLWSVVLGQPCTVCLEICLQSGPDSTRAVLESVLVSWERLEGHTVSINAVVDILNGFSIE